LPGAGGGVNWGGVAADPTRGLLFFHANDSSLVGWIEVKKPGKNYGNNTEGSTIPYDRGSVDGPGPYASFTAPVMNEAGERVGSLPCYRPPWSRLTAIDASSGEVAWETVLGISEALPPEKQLVGSTGSAGPIVTASNLVFVGATSDRRFRAFDAQTGRQLWEVTLESNVNANPMTYRTKSGRQFIVMATGSSDQNALLAFAVDEKK
jgi:quinoprotein glucose dehydrogenase